MPVAIFSRYFKELVPVNNSCLVVGEDIPEVPWDGVLCIYQLMLSQIIKEGFGLNKVSILTPADTSGLTIWSTNIETHKIDGSTFKPFSMVQVEDKVEEACPFFRRDIPSGWLNDNSFEEERLT